MNNDKSVRRLPLRQLLSSSEKTVRELQELVQKDFLAQIAHCRDLSRPVRRRSHYPPMTVLQEALGQFGASADRLNALTASLLEHLDALRDLGQRERVSRRL